MIGYAADNAAVMMGNIGGLKRKRTVPNLFVMGCICHSLRLCSSNACLILPRTVEDPQTHFTTQGNGMVCST